jgi:hypothetical protein
VEYKIRMALSFGCAPTPEIYGRTVKGSASAIWIMTLILGNCATGVRFSGRPPLLRL